jgi:hypothetical protein
MASEEASQEAVMMLVVARRRGSSKLSLLSCLARILFPVIHLLQKLFRLLLVDEGQSRQAFLQLEGMEKNAVLVVAPVLKDLLVPDHSPVSGLPPCQQSSLTIQTSELQYVPKCPPS